MEATALFLNNYQEIEDWEAKTEKMGYSEGDKPKESFSSNDFCFTLYEVRVAWKFNDNGKDRINIKLVDGEVWSLVYNDSLWNQLKNQINGTFNNS